MVSSRPEFKLIGHPLAYVHPPFNESGYGPVLLIEITPAVLDTVRIDIVYEALAILLTITKVERLSRLFWLRLDSFFCFS